MTSKKAKQQLSAFLRGDQVYTVTVDLSPFFQNVGPCGDISVLSVKKQADGLTAIA